MLTVSDVEKRVETGSDHRVFGRRNVMNDFFFLGDEGGGGKGGGGS